MLDLSKNYQAFAEIKTKPKAIVFDWDNTLVDTWPLIHVAINKARVAFGKEPWSLKDVKDKVHKSMRESFPVMFGDDWQAAGKIYLDSYAKNNLTHLKLLDGSMDLLEELKKQGIRVFLVSNKIGITLRKEVAALNLNEYFFSVIGSMDADFDKPGDEPVRLALQGSDIDFEKDKNDIWFIGDTISDIDCAVNCGFTPIAYDCDQGSLSKSISESESFQDDSSNSVLAVYHCHSDLIKLIQSF